MEVDNEVVILSNSWILVLIEPTLHQNNEHKSMWNFNQVKFALTLVQKWSYQNEVIDLYNKQKTFKKLPHQEYNISNPF
jgi:hypothetical protein